VVFLRLEKIFMVAESIETTVARLDERLKGVDSFMAQMAEDQRSLTDSYRELVKNNQRIALVEAELISIKDGQKLLWIKFDALAAEGAKNSQRWLWEIGKNGILIAAAVIALKVFGVHL
jgi:hypothetical protein